MTLAKITLAFAVCIAAAIASPILNGYYMKIARWRSSPGTVVPKQLDASLLTHITLYFAKIDEFGNVVMADSSDGRVYDEFNYWVREQNPSIKTLLSIGGWDLNTNADTKTYFSEVAANATLRSNFASSAVAWARKYNFDGISLDWFFPAFTTQGGTAADKANFVELVSELKSAITADTSKTESLILAITVTGNLDVAQSAYDVAKLAPLVDFINVMTFDYVGSWSTKTGVHTDFPSAKDSMDYFLVQGAPKAKLLMSTATFGRSFTVTDANNNAAETEIAVSGEGTALTASNTPGLVAYYEILTLKQDSSTKTAVDGLSGGSILTYNSNQWVGYDDVDAVTAKANYANAQGFGGMMIWSLDFDAFADGYPLTSAVSKALGVSSGSGSSTNSTTTTEPVDKDGVGATSMAFSVAAFLVILSIFM